MIVGALVLSRQPWTTTLETATRTEFRSIYAAFDTTSMQTLMIGVITKWQEFEIERRLVAMLHSPEEQAGTMVENFKLITLKLRRSLGF